MMDFGAYSVTPILFGDIALDGGAMFGVIPRKLWSLPFPPDSQNRVGLVMRGLLLQGEGRVILVDAGAGTRWSDREREALGLRTVPMEEALRAGGVSSEDVTDVIVTHLHFDHAGGLWLRGKGDALVPQFPHATLHVGSENLAWGQSPSRRERASYRREEVDALCAWPRLRHVLPGAEILPGIGSIASSGHSPGLQLPVIRGEGRRLIYPADVVPTHAHIRETWGMSFDVNPLLLLEEKRALFAPHESEETIFFLEHDPLYVACTVRWMERDFKMERKWTGEEWC